LLLPLIFVNLDPAGLLFIQLDLAFFFFDPTLLVLLSLNCLLLLLFLIAFLLNDGALFSFGECALQVLDLFF